MASAIQNEYSLLDITDVQLNDGDGVFIKATFLANYPGVNISITPSSSPTGTLDASVGPVDPHIIVYAANDDPPTQRIQLIRFLVANGTDGHYVENVPKSLFPDDWGIEVFNNCGLSWASVDMRIVGVAG